MRLTGATENETSTDDIEAESDPRARAFPSFLSNKESRKKVFPSSSSASSAPSQSGVMPLVFVNRADPQPQGSPVAQANEPAPEDHEPDASDDVDAALMLQDHGHEFGAQHERLSTQEEQAADEAFRTRTQPMQIQLSSLLDHDDGFPELSHSDDEQLAGDNNEDQGSDKSDGGDDRDVDVEEAPPPAFDLDALLQNRGDGSFLDGIHEDGQDQSPARKSSERDEANDEHADTRSMHSDTSSVDSEILARREAVKKYGDSDSDDDDLEYEHDDDDDDDDEEENTKGSAAKKGQEGSEEEDDDSTEFV
jgi:hypothetical protein